MKDRLLSWSGLFFWALLGGLQLHAAWSERALIPLLLAFESALIGYRLVARAAEASLPVGLGKRLAAWFSLFAPLALQGTGEALLGQGLAVGGLLLTVWALATLGPSFGVAPADRGLVTSGPYRFIRHPMYAGALLNALGFVIANLTAWNLAVFALMAVMAVLRIRWEEAILHTYDRYAARVSFRLVPGVW